MGDEGPATTSGQPPQGPKSAMDIEREQEAKLAKKYGGLAKKKIMPKEHAYFDSADWALSKQGLKPADSAGAAPGPAPTALPPMLTSEQPADAEALRPRRSSHLGDSGSLGSSLGGAASLGASSLGGPPLRRSSLGGGTAGGSN